MTYIKGGILSATQINKLSNSGGRPEGAEFIRITPDSVRRVNVLNITYTELSNNVNAGKIMNALDESMIQLIYSGVYDENGIYHAIFYNAHAIYDFHSDDTNSEMLCNPNNDVKYYSFDS